MSWLSWRYLFPDRLATKLVINFDRPSLDVEIETIRFELDVASHFSSEPFFN